MFALKFWQDDLKSCNYHWCNILGYRDNVTVNEVKHSNS